jgi:hypothetical protein
MKTTMFWLAVAGVVAFASPAAAQVAGAWHVAGKVSTFDFTLNCDFKPDGSRLGGVCIDASTNDPKVNAGQSHTLTAGSLNGDKVSWTYQSSFLFTRFDVTFTGTRTGGRMSGTIDAQGHGGTFIAVRQ